jgi:hypothetical protein
MHLLLPAELSVGPGWLLPLLIALIAVPLTVTVPIRHPTETAVARRAAIVLTGLIAAANTASLVLLIRELLGTSTIEGNQLLYAGALVWGLNVIAFSLLYYEIDRGGPVRRLGDDPPPPGFLFPQMTVPELAEGWQPRYVDYFYVAGTNGTAFSPTDTMPLLPWAKLLMFVQATASFVTIGLVIARAVNILG